MKIEVAEAIEELRRQFAQSELVVNPDEDGGARVIIEPVRIGEKYQPGATWLGFHITALYPYADIYPMFIGGEVHRVDATALAPPITPGHTFEGRSATQISRRNAAAAGGLQTAVAKALKIIRFLEEQQ